MTFLLNFNAIKAGFSVNSTGLSQLHDEQLLPLFNIRLDDESMGLKVSGITDKMNHVEIELGRHICTMRHPVFGHIITGTGPTALKAQEHNLQDG